MFGVLIWAAVRLGLFGWFASEICGEPLEFDVLMQQGMGGVGQLIDDAIWQFERGGLRKKIIPKAGFLEPRKEQVIQLPVGLHFPFQLGQFVFLAIY